jgi:hypothetical protein
MIQSDSSHHWLRYRTVYAPVVQIATDLTSRAVIATAASSDMARDDILRAYLNQEESMILVTVSGSILQLSDDDSTSSSRMEREEEKE